MLGFPTNDFGGQEPGSNKDIAAFCVNQYAIVDRSGKQVLSFDTRSEPNDPRLLSSLERFLSTQ